MGHEANNRLTKVDGKKDSWQTIRARVQNVPDDFLIRRRLIRCDDCTRVWRETTLRRDGRCTWVVFEWKKKPPGGFANEDSFAATRAK